MEGRIIQVSTSPGGVPNRAVLEGQLGVEGFAGDGWNNRKFHGGPQQAVLLIAMEVLDELREKGFRVFPGALGENLTTEGLDFAELRAGLRFQAGEALVELTKIRVPCQTLDVYGTGIQKEIYDGSVKQGDPSSPRWAKSGFYAKVLRPGLVRAGDSITLSTADADEVPADSQT